MKRSTTSRAAPGAFDDAITANGRIDPKRLARVLDLPLATIARALGLSQRSAKLSATSPKVQSNAAELLAMNELALSFTNKRYAIFWLKTSCEAFGGHTPAHADDGTSRMIGHAEGAP
jgi:hypothetical protein